MSNRYIPQFHSLDLHPEPTRSFLPNNPRLVPEPLLLNFVNQLRNIREQKRNRKIRLGRTRKIKRSFLLSGILIVYELREKSGGRDRFSRTLFSCTPHEHKLHYTLHFPPDFCVDFVPAITQKRSLRNLETTP